MSPAIEIENYLPLDIKSAKDVTSNDFLVLKLDDSSQHKLVLSTFRCLIADLCENFRGGHPGYV